MRRRSWAHAIRNVAGAPLEGGDGEQGLTRLWSGAFSTSMFQISAKQLAAFQEENLGEFEREMVVQLRRVLPARVAHFDDAALARSLRRRLDQALAYGITDRLDVLRYLESSYALGWTEEGPDQEARAVLAREELRAEEKVDIIESRAASI
jgi:hypothetical protein